ncbi:MAG: cyclase family protein [Anaerolineae bacterium]|nr:cyclase family protein [Anaerolineae bacterium]MCO5205499.1 cyclase family protein [Anaerolineae bacterium]
MTIYDISRTLDPSIAVWPGDTPYDLAQILDRQQGDSVNLTTLTISAHTGTHADAPLHFTDNGTSMEKMPLDIYWGLAQVVTVKREAGALTSADFAAVDLSLAPRLLVHSVASHRDPTVFYPDFVYPSPELADLLAAHGVILYGADGPSMDDWQSAELPGHNALLRHGISIIEGLDLSGVPDGVYEFVGLPLKIAGGDGSPIRAALRPLSSDAG